MRYRTKEKIKNFFIKICAIIGILACIAEYKPKFAMKVYYSVYNLIAPYNNTDISKLYIDSNMKIRLKRNKFLYSGNIVVDLSEHTSQRLGKAKIQVRNGELKSPVLTIDYKNGNKYLEVSNPTNPFLKVYYENGNLLLEGSMRTNNNFILYSETGEILSKNKALYYGNGNIMYKKDSQNEYFYYNSGQLFERRNDDEVILYYENGNILAKKDLKSNISIYYDNEGKIISSAYYDYNEKRVKINSKREEAIKLEEKLRKELNFEDLIPSIQSKLNKLNSEIEYLSKVFSLFENILLLGIY